MFSGPVPALMGPALSICGNIIVHDNPNKLPCCKQYGIQENERKRVFEGEAPQAYACGGGDASPIS